MLHHEISRPAWETQETAERGLTLTASAIIVARVITALWYPGATGDGNVLLQYCVCRVTSAVSRRLQRNVREEGISYPGPTHGKSITLSAWASFLAPHRKISSPVSLSLPSDRLTSVALPFFTSPSYFRYLCFSLSPRHGFLSPSQTVQIKQILQYACCLTPNGVFRLPSLSPLSFWHSLSLSLSLHTFTWPAG